MAKNGRVEYVYVDSMCSMSYQFLWRRAQNQIFVKSDDPGLWRRVKIGRNTNDIKIGSFVKPCWAGVLSSDQQQVLQHPRIPEELRVGAPCVRCVS